MLLVSGFLHASDQPHWVRVSSDHFVVITDAGQKKGHDIAARFEQMRAVFGDLLRRKQVRLGEPVEIIAMADPARYVQLAPAVNGSTLNTPGFFLKDDDRIFIVLNASDPDSWRAVEYRMARFFLNYNYPPTQPWFDEGIAEYFSSLYFTAQKTELGADPDVAAPPQAPGSPVKPNSAGNEALTAILAQPDWMSLPDLLQTKDAASADEGPRHSKFAAQSWMLVHYLINKDKLSETGAYFGLVELQKVPVEQAIQQAFGISAAQLDQAVKDYFHSLKPLAASLEQSRRSNPPSIPESVNESPLPFSVEDVSATNTQLQVPEAVAYIDELKLRIPAHRDQAIQELQKMESDGTETIAGNRALAWVLLQKGETKEAYDHLNAAMQMRPDDPYTRYDIALASYRLGDKGARVQGLANMMESLHIVIDHYPDFAEAYNILGWAQLAGGGANAAIDSFKKAVQLAPRNELYQLRLAKAYVGARKWDEGSAILDRLQASQDSQIAAEAKKDLHDLPFLKRFGIPPQEQSPAAAAQTEPAEKSAHASAKSDEKAPKEDSSDDDPEITVKENNTVTKIDKRPVQFMKAKLLSVDCSQIPAAVLLLAKAGRTLKLRTTDYNNVAVMGADKFSCSWKDVPVNVNYRSSGKGEGDLVSIELQ